MTEQDRYRASIALAPEIKGDDKPVLFGRFAEFETWAEVNSVVEGHFMERTASSAFRKTVKENRGKMRVLFNHGRDALGYQVLGQIQELDEDSYHEVELFESVPPLILDGLRAQQYGSSYRFGIVKHEFVRRPKPSEHNPQGLPELTVLEARVREFGPTPFPIYAGTSQGLRSTTDEFIANRLAEHPEQLEQMLGRSTISLNGLGHATATSSSQFPATRTEDDSVFYKRSVDLVGSAVWAIHPDALATIVGIIGERASGHKPSAEEIRERIGNHERAEPPDTSNSSVAVVPIHGMIVPRADLFNDMSGGTSVESVQKQFRAAMDSEDISAVVLDIDSPGGDARMIPELAAEIRAARGGKPIVAVANTMAASAAYFLASAADEIVVTPSGDVGAIGVYTAHTDLAEAQKKAGVKTTLVSAGEYKVERNPFEPLSESAKTALQERVDALYDVFVDAVADGRGVDRETVLEDFGKGRMMLAPLAVKAGMADSIGTLEETITRLESEPPATTQTVLAGQEGHGEDPAPAIDRAGDTHPVSARRDRTLYSTSRKETESWRIQ